MFTIDMGIRAKVLKKSSDEFPNPLYEMIFHADVSVGNIQTKTPQVVSILRYLLRNLDLKYLQNMLRAEPESGMKISALQQAFDRGNRELAGVIFEALAQTTGEKIKLLKSIKQAVQPNIFPFLITRFCNFEVETKLLKRAQEGKAQDFEAIFKCNLHMVTPEIWRYKISELRGVSKVFGELELTLRNEKLEKLKVIYDKIQHAYYDHEVEESIESLKDLLEEKDSFFSDRLNLNVRGQEEAHGKLSLLSLIIKRNNIDLAIKLINLGANVNLIDANGGSALHYAAAKGHLDIVKALIDAGADVNLRDKKGKTPLHCSVTEGNTDVVILLIQKGANITQNEIGEAEQKEQQLKRENNVSATSFSEITNILKILKDPKDLQAQFAFAISLATKPDPLSSSYLGAFSADAKAKIMDFAKGISEIVIEHVNKTIKPHAQAQQRQL